MAGPEDKKKPANPYADIAEVDPNAPPPAVDPDLVNPVETTGEPYQEPGFLPAVGRFMTGQSDIYKSDDALTQRVKQSFSPANIMETGISAVGSLYHGIADPVADVVQRFPESVFGRDTTYNRFIDQPTDVQIGKGKQAAGVERAARYAAGSVPIFGPAVAHVGARLGTGDIGGALTEAGVQYVTPKVVGEMIGTPGAAKARLQRNFRTVTGAEDALREQVRSAATKYETENEANLAKRREVIEGNARARREQLQKDDLAKIDVREENARIDAKNREQSEAVEQRKQLDLRSDQEATNAQNAAGQLENRLWQENNRLWNAAKEKIGDDVREPLDEVNSAVGIVKAEVLRDIPESLPLLDQITNAVAPEGGGAAAIDRDAIQREVVEGLTPGRPYSELNAEGRARVERIVNEDINRRLRPPDAAGAAPQGANWSQLQRMKTALEEQMRKPGINPTYKYALRQVHEAVTNTMGRIAEAKGAVEEWRTARDFTRKWREAFHDKGSYAKQLLEARSIPDAQRVLRKGQSASGNYLSGLFRQFSGFGGNDAAAAVDAYNNTVGEMKGMPQKVKITANKPTPEVFPQPKPKTPPPRIERPTVDAAEVSRRAIEQSSKHIGKWNARDAGIIMSSVILGPFLKGLFGQGEGASNLLPEAAISYEGGKYAVSRFLKNPGVIRWLERTPPEEIAALQRIPGADKVRIINAMTQEAVQAARSGKVVQLTDAAKQFLGDTNVRLILAAQAQQNPVQTPGQARQRLTPPAQ